LDEWDLLPELDEELGGADDVTTSRDLQTPPAEPTGVGAPSLMTDRDADGVESGNADGVSGPRSLLGYLHLQFCVKEETPLLCVLNMQLAPHVMGKGLGKFALQLVELMARQLQMELVMLYVKNGKVTTMRLSHSKHAAEAQFSPPPEAVTELLRRANSAPDGGCADSPPHSPPHSPQRTSFRAVDGKEKEQDPPSPPSSGARPARDKAEAYELVTSPHSALAPAAAAIQVH